MAGCVVFVASAGGHVEELHQLRPSLVDADTRVVWVTFDHPQTRSLLKDEADVRYIRRVDSRGYFDLLRTLLPALRLLLRLRPDEVYSTGAGVALAYLPFAWLVRARAVYIESAARTAGPSFTGRLLQLFPWIRLRTQYEAWAGRRWTYAGSVFDGYVAVEAAQPCPKIRKVVVTLGTQRGYPFVSLVERMQQIVPDGVEVLWQIGADFPAASRPAGARDVVSTSELDEWVAAADVVVAHAGVGSALTLLRCGRTPVLVPRSARRGEHVDEHQVFVAHELTARGLAVSAPPHELTWEHIARSTATAAARATAAGAPVAPVHIVPRPRRTGRGTTTAPAPTRA